MGIVVSCCSSLCGDKEGQDSYQTIGGVTNDRHSHPAPDPEERRQKLAEAAERRREEEERRGVKDVDAVRRMKQRTERREQLEDEAAMRGNSGSDANTLQWTVK